jgi:hypothetical protein
MISLDMSPTNDGSATILALSDTAGRIEVGGATTADVEPEATSGEHHAR